MNPFHKTRTNAGIRVLFFPLLVLLLLFSGCQVNRDTPPAHPTPVLTQPPSFTGQPADFASFSAKLFRALVSSDALTLHYTLLSPENYGITPSAASFGSVTDNESTQEPALTADDLLKQLHAFDKSGLSEEDQFLYELTDAYLSSSVFPKGTEYYGSLLGPSTGLSAQLPVLLSEYRFSSKKDVENYFTLLQDLPRFFGEVADYEQQRAKRGLCPCKEVLSMLCEQCSTFVKNPDENPLITGFYARLQSVPGISAKETAALCVQNQQLVYRFVLPAYESLYDVLTGLADSAGTPQGYCAFPYGKAYYETLVRKKTSSDKTVPELKELLETALYESLLQIVTLARTPSFEEDLAAYRKRCASLSAEEGFAALQERMKEAFPELPSVSCRLLSMPASLSSFLSPALYLVPPLDGYQENTIYINEEKCDTESLFPTLAHEGYPGHLLAHVTFAAANPNPLRLLLSFPGYDEGWATYAELFSYRYADCSDTLRQYLAAEQIAGLCLYSLSDMKIHYYGEDFETVLRFLTDYGLPADSAETLYYMQLAEPASYLPYSVGYLELELLKKDYLKAFPDATELDFHTAVLQTGPAPFSVLRNYLLPKSYYSQPAKTAP